MGVSVERVFTENRVMSGAVPDPHVVTEDGARVEVTDIEFNKASFIQPRYTFRREAGNGLDFSFPAEARLGLAAVEAGLSVALLPGATPHAPLTSARALLHFESMVHVSELPK